MIPFFDIKRLHEPYLSELQTMLNVAVESGWYIQGQYVKEFEKEFARYLGARHVVGVGNGYDALKLIFKAYIALGRLAPGDEVIVPANTFIASILAISDNGLVPVLVEPDMDTYNIDMLKVNDSINSRTKAIMAVNLYGRIADMESLQLVCKDRNLLLIEDNAQAAGAKCGKRYSGTFGDAAGFSFYPAKNLGALGDGGAVVTGDKELSEVVRALSNYGSEEKYIHKYKGVNSRLDELQAAALLVKLKYLARENEQRRKIAKRYCEGINNPMLVLPACDAGKDHVWHLFVVRCSKRDELTQFLEKQGIQTQIHYPIPIHQQEAYRELFMTALPVAEKIAGEVISLPMAPYLTDEEVNYIIEVVNQF